MTYKVVPLGKSDPDDIWIKKQLIRIDPSIKDHDTEYSVARAMRKLVLELRGDLPKPKSDTKELIAKYCDTPRTQLEIRTELKLSKSVIQRHVREMADAGTLFCVGDYPAPLWCAKIGHKVKKAKKAVNTNAPKLTKWQKVEPWGVKK